MKIFSFYVRYTDKMAFFTYLAPIFAAIKQAQQNYDWLLTDLDCNYFPPLLENFKQKQAIWLTGKQITDLADMEHSPQFIWGVLSAVLPTDKINFADLTNRNLPYAEDNNDFWQDDYHMQLPNAHIEIIAHDSSRFIFSTNQLEIAENFADYFPEAVNLAVFNQIYHQVIAYQTYQIELFWQFLLELQRQHNLSKQQLTALLNQIYADLTAENVAKNMVVDSLEKLKDWHPLRCAFGIWKNNSETIDGLAYQEKIRAEWNRDF